LLFHCHCWVDFIHQRGIVGAFLGYAGFVTVDRPCAVFPLWLASATPKPDDSPWSKIPDILKTWDKGGPFVAGIVFGFFMSWLFLRLASGERKRRMELDSLREAELAKQLNEKDKRISALHDEIDKVHAEMNSIIKNQKT
jgi:hypothetical protein